MGGQTRVNLVSGGHTLPGETGASRLAPPLMALHLLTQTHTHTHMHVRYGPGALLYHRDVSLVRTQL